MIPFLRKYHRNLKTYKPIRHRSQFQLRHILRSIMTCRKIIFCLLLFTSLEIISAGQMQASAESDEYISYSLTKKNHKKVLSENKYVFVKFYTDW